MEFKTDNDIIYPYTYDSSNMKGFAEMLFVPGNIEELQTGIKKLYDENIQITISGAGTGITGARVPQGGAVISTERLNSMKLSSDYSTVFVGPAATLNQLDEFLSENGLFLPPNPTEYNASIGGNVATNASGARTFKYGAIRNFVKSLKMVLPNGDLISIKRGQIISNDNKLEIKSESGIIYKIDLPTYQMPKVKNASGYFVKDNLDAIDLFIGSEGTLGLFVEIELEIFKRPENILGGIVFFDNKNNLLDFVNILRKTSLTNNSINILENKNITARLIEYFDIESLKLLKFKYPEIPENAIGAVWFEQEFNPEFEEKLMEDWYSFISNHTLLNDDTWFALNDKDHLKLKEFRHELPLQVYENLTNNSQKKVGLDCAVPSENFDELFNFYYENCPKLGLEYVVFGHIGNCHLHVNIFCKNEDEYILAREFYDKSIDLALSFKGTVSAEHGIGKLKKPYLVKMYGQNAIQEMINVKKVLDDKLLLNIGTMFDIE
jgi:D-lactate dehydrogenase (cytochrome)